MRIMREEKLHRSPRPLTPRERMWVDNFHAHETPASLKLAADYIDSLHLGDTVLEVGCAFGRVTNFLENKRDVVATGVDINPAEINYAKEHYLHSKVDFAVMDGTQLEFPDNSFNAVVMLGIIGGVEPEIRENLLAEAYRVVRSGGTVAIAEFKMNLGDPERVKKYEEDKAITGEWGSRIVRKGNKTLFIAKHFTEDELTHLLLGAGFCSIQLREHTVETAGIGDGIVEIRQQYTVWGVKPLNLL